MVIGGSCLPLGGVFLGGCLRPGGGLRSGGVCLGGGGLPVTCDACWEATPQVNRMTHRCENITLPQTSFKNITLPPTSFVGDSKMCKIINCQSIMKRTLPVAALKPGSSFEIRPGYSEHLLRC